MVEDSPFCTLDNFIENHLKQYRNICTLFADVFYLNEAKWRIYALYKITIIGSDNGFSPGRHQSIIWSNGGILLFGFLETVDF